MKLEYWVGVGFALGVVAYKVAKNKHDERLRSSPVKRYSPAMSSREWNRIERIRSGR